MHGMTSVLYFSEKSKRSFPQYLQTFASLLINSAQEEHIRYSNRGHAYAKWSVWKTLNYRTEKWCNLSHLSDVIFHIKVGSTLNWISRREVVSPVR
jgi:hypothetical protein